MNDIAVVEREINDQLFDMMEFVFNAGHHPDRNRAKQIESQIKDIGHVLRENGDVRFGMDAPARHV